MKNFVLGVIVGIVALCGYKPIRLRWSIGTIWPLARMHKGLSIASPVWTLLAGVAGVSSGSAMAKSSQFRRENSSECK